MSLQQVRIDQPGPFANKIVAIVHLRMMCLQLKIALESLICSPNYLKICLKLDLRTFGTTIAIEETNAKSNFRG